MIAPATPAANENRGYRPGTIIAGKYRLQRVLGEGGQGCVWEALNLSLDVCVAIKFVTLGGENGSQMARLLLEARTAAQLRHPGIVRVFDFGETPNGDSFLVMELLEGESLSRALARAGRFSPEAALRLLLPIAEAVGAAHARGVVHRDIKPENIFIAKFEQQTQPKLLDFGIAKVDDAPTPASHLTRAGTIVGSPAYLSPEQARGEAHIDQRADVWAFAATLYQCITGKLPFWRDSYNALLWSIVEDEPASIMELGVPQPALWDILRRGLSKSKTKRWDSMQAFGRALAAWLHSRGVSDDVSGVPLQARWLTSSASAAAALAPARQEPPHTSERGEPSYAPSFSRSVSLSPARRREGRSALGFGLAVAAGLLGGALLWLAPHVQANASAAQPAPLTRLQPPSTTHVAPSAPTPVAHAVAAATAPRVTVVTQPGAAAAAAHAGVAAPTAPTTAPGASSAAAPAAMSEGARVKEPASTAPAPRKRRRVSNPEAELMNPY